jgi:NADH-ubiquinone oxidoreductase chain 6
MNENFFNGYNIIILDIFYFCIILFGILIITTKNPIHSILYLIFLFSIIALYLIYLELDFIGLSYLIVYIGAVSILFLFILMLINVRTSEIQSNTNNSIPLIFMILILFSNALTKTLPNNIYVDNNTIIKFNNNFKNLLFVSGNT